MKDFVVNIREEMMFYGVDNTPLQYLLAIIIGGKLANAENTGILAGIGIRRLAEMSEIELIDLGIGKVSAQRIVAACGLIGHYLKSKKDEEDFIIRSPEDAATLFQDLKYKNQEQFEVAFLNTKNKVISRKTIFKGSLNASIVHPREVFREAVKLSAASIIVAHQHPSGDPTPSREDLEVTKRLVECGRMMGIELLDHVIIGESKYISLKEKGHI
ncbi:RadC family protein [Ferdinandcohnia sp. SAFN-114]|uniref:RadC family protein n=1 Tax=Ferdinandcohnia sp. SAFN-114 TaxID=3387275 RepID=UPI003F7EC066